MSLTLTPIFASGMVLQRELPVCVWGAAEPGTHVDVRIQGQTASCVADGDGCWRCTLAPLAASDAETLEVISGVEHLALNDVAVGEVFIAGGQSNMEFWMRYDKEVEDYRPTCANPRIRFYDQPKCSYPGQMEDFDYSEVGIWRKATPEDLDRFSAVGYYCARGLEMVLDVPVGIVGCNYGGTTSAAWMTPEHARAVQPELAAAFDAKLQGLPYEELLAHGRVNAAKNDKGYATWPAWNEFFLPKTPTEEEVKAFMAAEAKKGSGAGDVGGLEVGGSRTSDGTDANIHPGMMTPTKEAPGALFTYMVLPIAGFTARCVLWYQGESDDEIDGTQWRHERALRTVIADWRAAWQRPDLPFLVVQLPGFGEWMGLGPNDYVTIRACQQKVADEDEHVWLCSASDMGDKHDIHPKEKKPIGERLALLAMNHLLGMPVPADAPRCVGAERKGSFVVLHFEHAGSGMEIAGAECNALEVLHDGSTVPFRAAARGDELIVMLEGDRPGPIEVRFAWSNWFRANLYNSAEIPALPFKVSC
jgi:sialate O-acetylesterase